MQIGRDVVKSSRYLHLEIFCICKTSKQKVHTSNSIVRKISLSMMYPTLIHRMGTLVFSFKMKVFVTHNCLPDHCQSWQGHSQGRAPEHHVHSFPVGDLSQEGPPVQRQKVLVRLSQVNQKRKQ